MASSADDRAARPFFIGVAGGSNSGKTTIAARLATMISPDRLSLVELDSYYRAWDGEPLDRRAAANYDHPDAFDWQLLSQHVDALLHGTGVDVPVYDFADFNRTDGVRRLDARPVILIEGILVLWEPSIRERLDLKIFVDAPADLRLIRRIERDITERGRTIQSVITQYLDTVRPSHENFVEPSKRFADVIIPGGGHNAAALEVLRARVLELTRDGTA